MFAVSADLSASAATRAADVLQLFVKKKKMIAKIVEIYRNREQDMIVFLQRTVIEKDRETNILDLRTSNYGIICTEKCKNKIR